jgi:hypothetical protein
VNEYQSYDERTQNDEMEEIRRRLWLPLFMLFLKKRGKKTSVFKPGHRPELQTVYSLITGLLNDILSAIFYLEQNNMTF